MAEPLAVMGAAATPARRLAQETARLAARLADLVGGFAADAADETLAEVVRFLRGMGGGASGIGEPEEPQPLDRLVRGLGLAPVELDLLLLAGLAEEHEGYAAAFRRVGPAGEPHATVGLAARLLCADLEERAALRSVVETGAAVRAGALAVDRGSPFFERVLRVGDGLWSALHGIDVWPAGVRRLAGPAPAEGLEDWLGCADARRAAAALHAGGAVTVLVTAPSESAALARAAALAAAAGVKCVRLDGDAGTSWPLVGAHAVARGCVPLVRLHRPEPGAEAAPPAFGDHPAPVVLCGRDGAAAADGRPLLAVAAAPLHATARRRMWRAALPELAPEAAKLAARHALEPAAAARAALDVRAVRALDGGAPTVRDVARSIRVRAGVSLTAGVALTPPTATWEQLVVRPDREAQLREALDRLRHQSIVLDEWGFLAGRSGARGVRMLFAGPPGTGKTLAAEVLAHELDVELLVVDVSRVVSKWIGETEKNLAEVFDAAEQAQAVLFFDEADALFGRRTEVTDAHDRYANLETAYLLARLERFDGLAVLATNLRQNIDPAFTRRLEFAVDFDEPTRAEREALWRCHLPEGAPVADDVDLDELAALYPVVGAVIRNAAAAAAFLAAAEDAPIGRGHLIRAVRREYEKAGRAFPGAPTEPTIAGRSHA